ncbi:uncharacterized protein LOC105700889 [Orussus abietinus]|uniref:uncharacterized protein LOC105700889 n=1 Tax=Orussus abietinus TaxID=222816 RepID=UPI0006267F62|nr:uncharacterized protein LOC105700889 [Orussus abietinus]
MSNRLGIGLLICSAVFFVFTAADITEDNYEDVGEREKYDLLDFLKAYARKQQDQRRETEREYETWTGRWMPDRADDPTPRPKIFPKQKIDSDSQHQIPMDVIPGCDDGKTNLTMDWDHSPVNYTCFGRKIIPSYAIKPQIYCESIPKMYKAVHECMQEKIEYLDDIPLYGTHRPVWPVYGEYTFVPKQRWLHSLEHGAVVMLYHPCANPLEVKRLKSLVSECLWRHVISPYQLLDEDRPLALLTWGCRLTMSYVNPSLVKDFIKEHALRGPEDISRDGEFKDGLFRKAKIVSNAEDIRLCPSV